MYINGKETEGEILDAQKARKIYEDILRRMKDPALLEYQNQQLLRVRIFPVPAGGEQRVKLTYTHSLKTENGTVAYTFPFRQVGEKAKAIGQVSFKVEVESQQAIKALYCPTYEMEINRKDDHHATLGFEAQNMTPEHDLKIYYAGSKEKMDISLLNFREAKKEGFFFLNLSPGLATKEEIVNKDITFVLDASGSMAGEKMEQAQKALSFCINNLNSKDRFNIVRFSTEATALFNQLETASSSKVDEAEEYIEQLKAIGGTNIEEALDLALTTQKSTGRPHFIVFMTDGKPTIGETGLEALLKNVKVKNTADTRIFTFGIGTNLNTHLLDRITQMTNAYRTYVLPEEDIEIKVSDFFTKVSSPILTDLRVDFSDDLKVSQIYPKKLADLFKGSTLSILGKYRGSGKGTITLTGLVNGVKVTHKYPVDLAEKSLEHDFIPPMWATRAVGYLLEQIRLKGENKELVDEVVRLSKQYGIITPYTSYLILEDERQQISQRRLNQEDAIFSNRMNTGSALQREKITAEYESNMKKSEGSGSVIASEEVQEMNSSANLAQTQTGKERLDYQDQSGQQRNLADGIRYVQGRAVYQNGSQWVDAHTQSPANQQLKVRRVQFNSPDYFRLMQTSNENMAFLALGRNVRFMNGREIIEVYE